MKLIKYGFFTMLLALSVVSVSASDEHTHVWSDEWNWDMEYHWHECVMDGCKETDNLKKGGWGAHNNTLMIEDEAHLYSPPTCSHGARYYYTCKTCGRLTKETFEVGSGTGIHNYSELYYANETSHWHNCIYDGCEEKVGLEVHTFGDWVVTKEATYYEVGEMTKTCACGREETKAIPKLTEKPKDDDNPSNPTNPDIKPDPVPVPDDDPTNDADKKGSTAKKVELGILIGSGIFALVMVVLLIRTIRKYN